MLRGRSAECAVLDGMLEAVRDGSSRALVVRGEAGVGKTALLRYAVESAAEMRVARAVGVESEMELAFASLHQLCAPMLDRVEELPAPQRTALRIAFGLSAGAAPDRFLVGLAALTLISEFAEERSLLCLVDDAQWLDQASAQTLAFVARRLRMEPVGLVFAVREDAPELQGLPGLEVRGLRDGDARALLRSAVPFRLDERVLDLIVAETRGNPLALLELPRGLNAAQLAGGFGLLGGHALPGRIEESYLRRLEALPGETRLLMLVAAAEPVGDPLLVWAAAEHLGIDGSALAAATADGLLTLDERARFSHPLVRSAAYRSASPEARSAVHLALAEVTDRDVDPDRRAWHFAAAATAPDEDVALELERSAGRARARGGLAAAAAFLQRSVALTRVPARRTGPCPRRRCRQPACRFVRDGPRAGGRRGGRLAGSAPKRARGAPARAGRVCLQHRKRRAATAPEGGRTPRAARRAARARDVSGRVGGGAVRGSPRRRGRARRGVAGRPGGTAATTPAASI